MVKELCTYIWNKAATLEEIQSSTTHYSSPPHEKALSPKIIEAWRKHSCADNPRLFDQMIKWLEGQKRHSKVIRRVENTRWGRQLDWVIEAIKYPSNVSECHKQTDSIAFINIIDPIVFAATDRLLRKLKSAKLELLVSHAALEALQSDLRTNILNIATPIFFEAFLISKREKKYLSDNDLYEQFLRNFKAKHLNYIVEKYPVLFRLICTLCDQWIVTNAEFIKRFSRDRKLISDKFSDGFFSNLIITNIHPNLGDPHNNGRSVRKIVLSCGTELLYKPRSLKIDEDWSHLIELFNSSNPPTQLRVPKTLNRGKYGWSEFIAHSPCQETASFASFYERIGAWLFLFYILSATDIHEENIVAHGSQPIPIDLELTLQQHEGLKKDIFGRYLLDTAIEDAERFVSESVLATGLMPAYGRDINDNIYRASGLGVANFEEYLIEWSGVNTAEMMPRLVRVNKVIRTNVPFTENEVGIYEKFHKSILDGFQSYAEFFLEQKNSPAFRLLYQRFAESYVRTLMKPTRFYSHLLKKATDYHELTDGILWGLMLKFPDRFVSWGEETEFRDSWVANRESQSLLTLCIPVFTMHTSSRDLCSLGETIDAFFGQSGFDSVKRRIEELDYEAIVTQAKLIQMVFANEKTQSNKDKNLQETNSIQEFQIKQKSADPKLHLRNFADKVFQHLQHLAIRKNGTAAWIGFDWLGDTVIPQLAPLGQDLYSGSGGIAIFLAAYGVAFDVPNSIKLCYEAIAPLRRLVNSNHSDMYARKVGTGLGNGTGSIVYTLTCLSQILNDSTLLKEAVNFSKVIDNRLLELDSAYDLIGGSTGSLVSLLNCYSIHNDQEILHKARIVADSLYKKSIPWGKCGNLWISEGMGTTPLTGLSHGASGFAYAFSYLFHLTNDRSYLDIRNGCLDFEDSCFDSSQKAWPDLRESAIQAEVTWPSQWCHGSTGIGLSRLAMLGICKQDDSRLISDLELAIASTKGSWPYPVDTVCCGSAGNLWFLFEAGQFLDTPGLTNLATERFVEMITHAEPDFAFRWTTVGSANYNIGFFRGLAGIGYAAIRLSGAKIPNILIFE